MDLHTIMSYNKFRDISCDEELLKGKNNNG